MECVSEPEISRKIGHSGRREGLKYKKQPGWESDRVPEPVWWRSALLRNLVSCENRPKMADDRQFPLGLSNNPGCLLNGQGLGITRHDVQDKKTLSRV